MSILDFIKNLFKNDEKYARLITQDLTKTYGESEPLEVGLYENKTPLVDKDVTIIINGVKYNRKTDSNGIARLNINLRPGVYDPHIIFKEKGYQQVHVFSKVTVKPVLVTDDLNMVEKDGSRFNAVVQDVNGNNLSDVKVLFNVNGVNYERTSDSNGVVGLNIILEAHDYKILTSSYGVVKTNTIHISEPSPKEEENTCCHYGYWIFGRDMKNVNLESLKNQGVTDILLNYYAFDAHGEDTVREWIRQANECGIKVHIWMQSFYNGEWQNPKNIDLSSKINEAKYYASIPEVYGIHLDYLRYPGNAYKTSGGTETINNFVKDVKAVIGDKFLSCAVMPETETKYYYGQDIEVLGSLCDAVLPMQYKGNYGAGSSWLASTTKLFSEMSNVWSGLQAYRSDDDPTILSSDELSDDISTCMSNGACGVLLFRYGLSPVINFPKR